jgi:hypothetical protein
MEHEDLSLLANHCRTAIEGLERAQEAPPLMVLREADLVQRAVVDMRDLLIERLRQDDTAAAARWRAALDRINVALSLIVGLEYPMGGIPRESAQQAREVLKSLLDEELL